jgi:hypothetical protein
VKYDSNIATYDALVRPFMVDFHAPVAWADSLACGDNLVPFYCQKLGLVMQVVRHTGKSSQLVPPGEYFLCTAQQHNASIAEQNHIARRRCPPHLPRLLPRTPESSQICMSCVPSSSALFISCLDLGALRPCLPSLQQKEGLGLF